MKWRNAVEASKWHTVLFVGEYSFFLYKTAFRKGGSLSSYTCGTKFLLETHFFAQSMVFHPFVITKHWI